MPEVTQITPDGDSFSQDLSIGIFGASNCDQIDLRYRVTRDKFDVPRFLAFFNKEDEEAASGPLFAVCRTLDPKNLDYHIHFRWQFTKEAVVLFVSFHAGVYPESEDEREPYAERFMPWLGSFFTHETAHADLYSEFDYPVEIRQSRFPLPLKVNISDDIEAEINGINLSLASIPEGINGARVNQGKKRLGIELLGATRTNFATFDLQSEIARLSSFALRLTETRDIK